MQTAPVGILGASGYAGLEATRILALHPRVELTVLGSDRWQGDTAARRAGAPGAAGALRYAPMDRALALARKCAVVLLATPVEASLELAPALLDAGATVIDLSGAFRLRDAAVFERAYGRVHPHPALLAQAIYGLPELVDVPAGTRLVANPGCYPTAAALALAPLVRAGLLARDESLIVDAASGTTGAGRKASEELSFTEVDQDFRAYRVLSHQHTPEIAQTLGVRLTFTAHLLPTRRGILATCYGRLAPDASGDALMHTLAHTYASQPFVDVLASPDEVSLKAVVGTNVCQLAVAFDRAGHDPGRVVVVSAIDNLVKGAAGQAVQNMNLALGWDAALGLDRLTRAA